jgi:hypothetical protein
LECFKLADNSTHPKAIWGLARTGWFQPPPGNCGQASAAAQPIAKIIRDQIKITFQVTEEIRLAARKICLKSRKILGRFHALCQKLRTILGKFLEICHESRTPLGTSHAMAGTFLGF